MKTYFEALLGLSHRDGSNDGSQNMFSLRNKKNYLLIIFSALVVYPGNYILYICTAGVAMQYLQLSSLRIPYHMDKVTSFSTVFQSDQDDGQMIMKGCVQWNHIYF